MNPACAMHEPESARLARAALAPAFMTLRRMLMQLCGVLLLYRGSHPATREGISVTLAALAREHAQTAELLDKLAADLPECRTVIPAARYLRLVITELQLSLPARGGGLQRADTLLPVLQRAQRLLLRAADDRAGRTMVGFSHACCCAPASLSCH